MIAILSRAARLYSVIRLIEEGRKKGIAVRCFSPTGFELQLEPTRIGGMRYRGLPAPEISGVIPRVGSRFTDASLSVLRQFEFQGIPTLSSWSGILESRNKFWSLQRLVAQGIPVPDSTVASHLLRSRNLDVQAWGGFPVILKQLKGSQGLGVMKIDSSDSLKSVYEAFQQMGADLLLQRFIHESRGRDLRAFVVGDQIVATMERVATKDDFRANVHRGASTRSVTLKPQEARIALRAAAAFGLGVAGVDLLRTPSGCFVLEVNSSPGLEGIEKATGVNVAGALISEMIRRMSPKPNP